MLPTRQVRKRRGARYIIDMHGILNPGSGSTTTLLEEASPPASCNGRPALLHTPLPTCASSARRSAS